MKQPAKRYIKNMFKGFQKFVLRGNVVDLAVGVMIGAAFNGVITALVKDLMTPLIAAVVKQPDFSKFSFTVNGTQILYGDFLNALISFLITAITVYFFVVVPINKLSARLHAGSDEPPTTKKCPECLSDIPAEAKRCAHCTTQLVQEQPDSQ